MSRRRSGFVVAILFMFATGCASAPPPRDSRPPRAGEPSTAPQSSAIAPSPVTTSSPFDSCGESRGAALTTFNSDGSSRWSIDVPVGAEGSEPTPVADHDAIFSGHAGSVSAVRAADGSVEWNDDLGKSINSLWLVGDVLVVNVDQVSDHPEIVALDAATGATRWVYPVPGGGFMGAAALTGDGGLAFRVGDTGMMTVIDVATGQVRWSRKVADGRSSDDALPSTAPGLVLYAADDHVVALDSGDGEPRWQSPTDQLGRVVVSGDVAVVVPDIVSGPTVIVSAYDLGNGSELWHRQLADISAVYPDQAGFLLADYRADTLTLARPDNGAEVWHAQLTKIENLDQAPVRLGSGGVIAVLERQAVALVDPRTGEVRQVPNSGGVGRAAGARNDLLVTSFTRVSRVTAAGISWQAALPHFAQGDPVVLDDGAVTVQSEDAMCVSGGG